MEAMSVGQGHYPRVTANNIRAVRPLGGLDFSLGVGIISGLK